MIKGHDDVFDNETFIDALVNKPGSYINILLLLVGGACNANGDFLCATACSNLPSSVATPIYGGWALIQGTLLSFFVEKYDGSLPLLSSGVFVAWTAIMSMTASDYFAVDTDGSISHPSVTKPLLPQESKFVDEHAKLTVGKWIYVCCLAGMVTGSWAPMSIIATRGEGSVDNIYLVMFYFQSGQLLSVPFMIYYYIFFLAPPEAVKQSQVGFNYYAKTLVNTSRRDLILCSVTGVFVGCGFFLYFTAADVVASTISFALSNCSPLVTIFNDVTFFEHLKNSTVLQERFLFLAALLFVIAIVLMVLAENL